MGWRETITYYGIALEPIGQTAMLSVRRSPHPIVNKILLGILCSLLVTHTEVGWAESATSQQKPALPSGLSDSPLLNSRFLLFGSNKLRRQTLDWAVKRGKLDMVAPLITALRYLEAQQRGPVARALRKLTGKRFGDRWFDWMVWQQQQKELAPFDGYDVFLAALLQSLDKNFSTFIYPGIKHGIRLEEIVWGGAKAGTGIPALNSPRMIKASDAKYLSRTEKVFGVVINGDARAYPYRFMDWHEMLNDTVGGVPITLAYCTLCGSGILFESAPLGSHELAGKPLRFGSSGLLYRSNKLMFDETTNSLWNQFTGQPAAGTLANADLTLKTRALVTTTWKDWYAKHPDTQVLDINTGFERDYRPNGPYSDYFRSPDLLFPAASDDEATKPKAEVFVLRIPGVEHYWPLQDFKKTPVINSRAGALSLVLIGDASTKTVRAYRREGYTFENSEEGLTTRNASGEIESWKITEEALIGPNQETLTRLPGHLAYAFAWQTYYGGNDHEKNPATGR